MKVKALITLVIAEGKEIAIGDYTELDDKEAARLADLGFVEIIKAPAKGQTNGSAPAKNSE